MVRHKVSRKVTPSTSRCTFTIPSELAHDMSLVSRRFGCSQSALVSLLLEDPITQLAKLESVLAKTRLRSPSSGVQRLRGDSANQLRERLDEALELASHLLDGLPLGELQVELDR